MFHTKMLLKILVPLLSIVLAECRIGDNLLSHNPCVSKIKCRECIQTPSCAWCSKPDFGERPRCFQPALTPIQNLCPKQYTYDPGNEIAVIVNRELTRGGQATAGGGGTLVQSSGWEHSFSHEHSRNESMQWEAGASEQGSAYGHHRVTQIQPQRVALKLRINQGHQIQFRYSQAEDYPVDLYYLMDLSKSMEDDKEKLSLLGDTLAETMRKITSNFRLGFGSFVDKVLMPYVSTVPKKLEHPCDGCNPPYGYLNHMPLSTDTARFAEQVKAAKVSGNLDAPEGGFDAIMQAIVCRDEIGWRDQARRLLVFSTDAGFHYAGDGKLGGVIAPNDGKCHLEAGEYKTWSQKQDYPSISQLNLKVKENSINMIFAVTAQQIKVYESLAQNIEGSSCAVLSEDSSNIVDLIREEYSKIKSSVRIKDNTTESIKITYSSACLGNGPVLDTDKCDGLKVGDVVRFNAEIVVTSCPPDPKDWFQTIQIYPVGLNESLIIDLEMLCSCPCESDPLYGFEEKSEKCNFAGNYECGICTCDETHFGGRCECSAEDIDGGNGPGSNGCRLDNSTLVDCSGRGTCVCGLCDCEKRTDDEIISGRFCECDNFSCDRHNQLLCSGPDHGNCVCGQCQCLPGWTGSACDCKNTNTTCIQPNSELICSGHGECNCGACRCETTSEGRYSGKFCEKCPTCLGKCEELRYCVQCDIYKTGKIKPGAECLQNCTEMVIVHVEQVYADEEKDEYLCTFYDEDSCRFQFTYLEKDDGKIQVKAQSERECPPKVFMLGIILGVIAAIVLIGLAVLLLWKLLTTIHDRREFARFEKERMMAKWDTGENPIYKQATSTFKNPTYAGK